MKKLKMLIGLVVGILVIAGCSNGNGSNQEITKIGILQFIDHNSLNKAQEGFVDGLEEAGYTDGENIEIEVLNAQGDQSNLQSMSEQLTNNNELVLGIATPTAQSLAMANQNIPQLFTAVTDPVEAGLVDSLENPGGNITGTSDMADIESQVNLLIEIADNPEVIGLIYNSSEVNSQIQVDQAVEVIESRGLDTNIQTVTSTNDVQQTLSNLATNSDAIYIPTDNVLSATAATVGEIAKDNNVPIVPGSTDMVENGGLATLGIDYYNLGKQTAKLAVSILEGEEPSNLPVESTEDFDLVINEEMAEAIGINSEIIRQAADSLERGK
ncbi:MAG TPA: ABC transporter substrate-binding protein [Alloiococcus sp.]|nr:ABC transporter substrate-binding protein [Alloiococcus sp.]